MADFVDVYSEDFFRRHIPWRSSYFAVSDAMCDHLSFASALDLGCGNGYVLERLHERGKIVMGIEGSPSALPFIPANIRRNIRIHDLTQPLFTEAVDLVICTEVAEHLPKSAGEVLVSSICRHSKRYVFFTAATPGQRGTYHINEQPHSYWVSLFLTKGFELQLELTGTLRRILADSMLHAKWIPKNALVFVASSAT